MLEEFQDHQNEYIRQAAQHLARNHFSCTGDSSDIFFQQSYHYMPNEPENDDRDKFYFDDEAYH